MTAKPHMTTAELIGEVAREVFATLLVLALLIPWIIIHAAAWITSAIATRKGGLD